MKMAFTLDDLPLWPMSYPPAGYTAAGMVDALIAALDHHGIKGVYAFANSGPLLKHPEFTTIMERWIAAGHHVANHTHSHIELNEVSIETYIADIELGERHLSPWLAKAPQLYFRHPLGYWGDTREKCDRVRAHLSNRGYKVAEVTSWHYEWRWNRAYRNCLEHNDDAGRLFVEQSFLNFSLAQSAYDDLCARNWFGHDVIGILVGHPVPFFADIADEYFGALICAGVEFVSLDEATSDAAYAQAASVPTGEFLVYQQKLAEVAGKPFAMIEPHSQGLFDQITEMSTGQTG